MTKALKMWQFYIIMAYIYIYKMFSYYIYIRIYDISFILIIWGIGIKNLKYFVIAVLFKNDG